MTMNRIILTGASGWFGKCFLQKYEEIYGRDRLIKSVLPVASTKKKIEIGSRFGPIEAIGFDSLNSEIKCDAVVHMAFLTREKVNKQNIDWYIKTNRGITSKVLNILENNRKAHCFAISSGAAQYVKKSIVEDPYGNLKVEEEDSIQKIADQRLAMIFRVYGATGKFMKDPTIFALGDFISSAKCCKTIRIKSMREVSRSYVNLSFLSELILAIMENPLERGFYKIDASTCNITLLELGKLISKIWCLDEPIHQINTDLEPDEYIGCSKKLVQLADIYNVTVPSIEEQILETSEHIY